MPAAAPAARAAATAPLTGLQPRQSRSVRVQAAGRTAGRVQLSAEAAQLPASGPRSSQASNVVQAGGLTRAGGRATPGSWVGPAPAAPAAALHPRILAVQSAAELSHMAQCHTTRLLVVHFASPGCELDEAFRPALQQACTQHPEALFLTVAVQPGEVAAAASPYSLAAAAAVPGPGPGSTAERVQLLQGLSISALPCTLLMRGGQLLARVEMVPSSTGNAGGSRRAAPARAAGAAAEQLQAAMQAAQPCAAAAVP